MVVGVSPAVPGAGGVKVLGVRKGGARALTGIYYALGVLQLEGMDKLSVILAGIAFLLQVLRFSVKSPAGYTLRKNGGNLVVKLNHLSLLGRLAASYLLAFQEFQNAVVITCDLILFLFGHCKFKLTTDC